MTLLSQFSLESKAVNSGGSMGTASPFQSKARKELSRLLVNDSVVSVLIKDREDEIGQKNRRAPGLLKPD